MLNPFPELLMLSFFIPMILRMTAGGVFVYLAISHFKNKRAVAEELTWVSREVAVWATGILILFEIVIAAGLFFGIWTQIAAILAAAGCIKMSLLKRKFPKLAPLSRLAYLLLAIICLTLIISGAGIFAFDIPL